VTGRAGWRPGGGGRGCELALGGWPVVMRVVPLLFGVEAGPARAVPGGEGRGLVSLGGRGGGALEPGGACAWCRAGALGAGLAW
jgi:hypothetical protein